MSNQWTDANLRYRLTMALRKVYFMFPLRQAVLEKVRTSFPKIKLDGTPAMRKGKQMMTHHHECENCGRTKLSTGKIFVDHIDPVVPLGTPTSELGWSEYVERLFCSMDNLWAICDICHDHKTTLENDIRKQWRYYKKGTQSEQPPTKVGKDFANFKPRYEVKPKVPKNK